MTINEKNRLQLEHHIKQHVDVLEQLIREKFGIIIHKKSGGLQKIIIDACIHFNCSLEDYFIRLKNSTPSSPFLEHLISEITIQESYFFRDENQHQLLKNDLLPKLIEKKRQQNNLSIRIWSAGCAKGEEIYSITMQLLELLPDAQKWSLNLLGTDINTQALHNAVRGHYSEWAMRVINSYFKQKYFFLKKNNYVLKKQLRKMVRFDYLNLIDNSYPSIFNGTNAQDIILCRNVLIYFDNMHIETLMKKLSMSLTPGGYLLLGAADPVNINHTDLIYEADKGLVFKHPETQNLQNDFAHEQDEPASVTSHLDESTSVLITGYSPHDPFKKRDAALPLKNPIAKSEKVDILSPSILNAKAMALANLGKLEMAASIAKQSIQFDSTNKDSHFILALILVELDKIDEAEASLRKAIFLDHHFVEGHFQLGLLLLKTKRRELGLKSLQNALVIVQEKDPSHPVAGFKNLHYGRLTEILKKEINLYSLAGDL